MLIVKAGETFPSLISRRGDFEDWIIAGMGLTRDSVRVIDVRKTPLPSAHDMCSGIIVTGSHTTLTDHEAWSERTAAWLAEAVERSVPALGICYGHQLLAYGLGGTVGDNPQGPEFGTIEVYLSERAQEDRLLGGMGTAIGVHVGHTQTVLRLPKGAERLGFSERDRHQAFVVGGCAWGVQFHPEFDAEILIEYINHYREQLMEEGQDPDRLTEACRNTPYGVEILKRFALIVGAEA